MNIAVAITMGMLDKQMDEIDTQLSTATHPATIEYLMGKRAGLGNARATLSGASGVPDDPSRRTDEQRAAIDAVMTVPSIY